MKKLSAKQIKEQCQDVILGGITTEILYQFEDHQRVGDLPDKQYIKQLIIHGRRLMKKWNIEEFHGLGNLSTPIDEILKIHFPTS